MTQLRKRKAFKRFLGLYFSVFAVILVLVLGVFYFYLEDYQKNLPSEKGAAVIEAIRTMDMEALKKMSSNLPLSLTEAKNFSEYLKFFGDEPDLFFYAVTSKDDNQFVYMIANHDKNIATLTLEKSKEKSKFGFERVNIGDLVFKPVTNTKIVVKTQGELLINETPLTPQIQEVESSTLINFNPAMKPIEILTYSFKDFQHIISVRSPDHPEVEVSFDSQTSTYTVLTKVEPTIKDAITVFAQKAVKAHTRLWKVPEVTMNGFLSEFAYPKSQFERLVRMYDLSVKYEFIADEFTNFVIKDIHQYNANAFSAFVSIDYAVTSTYVGKFVTQVSHPACVFYFTNINGVWKITDMSIMASN